MNPFPSSSLPMSSAVSQRVPVPLPSSFSCEPCAAAPLPNTRFFSDRAQLVRHLKSYHAGVVIYHCAVCGFEEDLKKVNKHVKESPCGSQPGPAPSTTVTRPARQTRPRVTTARPAPSVPPPLPRLPYTSLNPSRLPYPLEQFRLDDHHHVWEEEEGDWLQ